MSKSVRVAIPKALPERSGRAQRRLRTVPPHNLGAAGTLIFILNMGGGMGLEGGGSGAGNLKIKPQKAQLKEKVSFRLPDTPV